MPYIDPDYMHNYRIMHKEEIQKREKIYWAAHPEGRKKKNRTYYKRHKEEHNERSRVYRQTHKEELAKYFEEHREEHTENLRTWGQKIRLEILQHYSSEHPSCLHCGTDDLEVLTIDHINNDGAEHRRRIDCPAGTAFYYWLRNNDYPVGFQVLCRNCNYKKLLQHRRDLRMSQKEEK